MTKKKTSEPRALPRDAALLDDLIDKCYSKLVKTVKKDFKLGDLLKMIEMRAKLTPNEAEQKEFWEMLDRIRARTLAEMNATKKKETPAAKVVGTSKKKRQP